MPIARQNSFLIPMLLAHYILLPPSQKVIFWDFSDRLVEKINICNTLSMSHMNPLKEGMSRGLLSN